MRSLKNNYRSVNCYRFVRETMPQYLTPTILEAEAGTPAMGYLDLGNLKMNQLVSFTNDFAALFARFKVDKIVTKLTPMYTTITASGADAKENFHFSPNLKVTRVNTKWLAEPFGFGANADAQTRELAQLQSKSTSMYASKKSMTIVTQNPGTFGLTLTDPTDVTSVKPVRNGNKWMDINDHSNAEFPHNSIIFMERIDGQDLTDDWQYHVTHKVYFRTSQVA